MKDMLYVEMNSAYMCNDGWNIVLKPNEKYISSKAFFGRTEGGLKIKIRCLKNAVLGHIHILLNTKIRRREKIGAD